MKIVCDSCGAKYSIADEKVAGKVFKIRCKKCQNIIVVRGNKPEDQPAADPALAAGGDAGDEFGDDTPVWHLVIDREQVGPMSPAEVRDRYANGDISEETFIWREGFSDWLRLDAVDDFADISQATKVAPSSVAMSGAAAAGGFQAPADSWGQQPQEEQPAWPDEQPAAQDAEQTEAWSGAEAAAPAAAPAAEPQDFGNEPAPAQEPAAGGGDSASLAFRDPGQQRRRDLFATYAGEENVADLMGPGGLAAAAGVPDNAQVSFPNDAGAAAGADPAAPAESPAFSSDPSIPPDEAKMTGQRNENSVLFSLGNLQALAMGKKASPEPGLAAPAADTGGDGSGLIDIRAMAGNAGLATGGAAASGDELGDLGTFAAPVSAAPVLLPSVEDERPKWLMPLIIGMAATLLIMVGLVVYLMMRKPTGPTVAANTPPAAAKGKAAAGSAAAVAKPKKAEPAKPADPAAGKAADPASPASDKAQPSAPAASAEKKAEPAKVAAKPKKKASSSRRSSKSRSSSKPRSTRSSRGSSDPLLGTAPPKKKKSRRKSGKRDELDDLIDGAISSNSKKRKASSRKRSRSSSSRSAPAAASNSNLPETLSRSDIQKGMRGIKGKVQGCYDRFKVPGLASVKVTIGRKGRVSNTKVKGVFAGTPTGSCVKKAAGGARFPKFKGTPFSITYPFILR